MWYYVAIFTLYINYPEISIATQAKINLKIFKFIRENRSHTISLEHKAKQKQFCKYKIHVQRIKKWPNYDLSDFLWIR